jgi:hypothetical protein
MPSWNELHYRRAQEFARVIGELAVSAGPPVAAPASSATPPAPVAPVAPAAPAAIPPTTPASSPTAGSLFNKMPWKK